MLGSKDNRRSISGIARTLSIDSGEKRRDEEKKEVQGIDESIERVKRRTVLRRKSYGCIDSPCVLKCFKATGSRSKPFRRGVTRSSL